MSLFHCVSRVKLRLFFHINETVLRYLVVYCCKIRMYTMLSRIVINDLE